MVKPILRFWLAAEVPAPEAVALLQALEGRLLVGGEDELSWRFHLGLTTQLVRERTRMSRRRVLQSRMAKALEGAPPSESKIRILLAADQVRQAVEDAIRWAHSRVADFRSAEVLAVFERMVPKLEGRDDIPAANLARFHLIRARVLSIADPTDTVQMWHWPFARTSWWILVQMAPIVWRWR